MSNSNDSVLNTSIDALKGIGPKRSKLLLTVPIKTVSDFLNYTPRCYQRCISFSQISQVHECEMGVVFGHVVRARVVGSKQHTRLEAIIRDSSGLIKLTFFGSHSVRYYLPKLESDMAVTAVGAIQSFAGSLQMTHPKLMLGDKRQESTAIVPIYSEFKNISSNDWANWIKSALAFLEKSSFLEFLPSDLLKSLKLLPLADAWRAIHQPRADLTERHLTLLNARNSPAFRRLAFDELVCFYIQQNRQTKKVDEGQAPIIEPHDAPSFLDFELTGAQARVVEEISRDLKRVKPMSRLVQGDVGCGKTAVAAISMWHAAKAGWQSALMAPTEILAEQHLHTLKGYFEPLGLKVGFLASSLSAKERRQTTAAIENHELDFVVGTHALISADVVFNKLGLCIVDEQHRFGVQQRAQLKQKTKSEQVPHLLAMTATPIPRSLALTLYGDLSLSVIDELPKGRKPVITQLISADSTQIASRLRFTLKPTDQAFVIYPLIEESEKMDLMDASSGYKTLCTQFSPNDVLLLHGKMKPAEKDDAMTRFAQGEIKILVSTTVVEVGVNIPNATHMVVMHAERFGLAQLHQLRGRVGRGTKPSECWLVSDRAFPGSDVHKRLSVLTASHDGFFIAEQDFQIRGPGELWGNKQSGHLPFTMCDLRVHADLLEPARELAERLVAEGEQLSGWQVERYFKSSTLEVS